MKKKYFLAVFATILFSMSGCSGFLDQEPDRILTGNQVYNDPNLIKSVLANYYERISWGQHVGGDVYDYTLLDEAIRYDYDDRRDFDRNRWRVYDYELVRNINQFIKGMTEISTLPDVEKAPLMGEARLIRAWYYFCLCRGLGGMPIVGDEVFDYKPGMDITPMQKTRSTEAEMYDYIISECKELSKILPDKKNKNSARANKWVAKMLEARAALYAASIAKYNNKMVNPVQTSGKEVGIDAGKAQAYYQTALAAAEDVIKNSPYILQDKRPDDRARNFYEATSLKDGNTEVIWARDYIYPGQTHGFTRMCLPTVLAQEGDHSYLSVLLNLAEEFEPIDTSTPGLGSKYETGTIKGDDIKFYNTADELFKDRDPRLGGTIIYPGSSFVGEMVVLQAGQLNMVNGKWEVKRGSISSQDEQGNLITGPNGPYYSSSERLLNKTGFYIRKFLDETTQAGTHGRGSEMWGIRFRIAEAYMIAAEAAFELRGGSDIDALKYINAVRGRAGVKPLSSITFENIVHEKRVEFAFEDHRIWDIKRWRIAHELWTGNNSDLTARRRALWPYRVVASGNPNNGKWAFIEMDMNFIYPNPLRFELRHYYQELDNPWLNNNPKLVKNPYQ